MTKVIETHPELDELLKEFKTETVAEEALRILQPIPENKWLIGDFINALGQRCAVGHYMHIKFGKNSDDINAQCSLRKASEEYFGLSGHTVASVNNGYAPGYEQPTAKQRVMALLQNMIKAGY